MASGGLPPDRGGPGQARMESGGGGGMTYAGTVGKRIMKREKLNILDIILERKDNSVSYNLNKEELSKLLFKKMKIDHKKVAKIDTSAFRSIHVEFIPGVELELYADLPTFEIREGLRSKIYRPHHRKDLLVTVSWLDLETPDELVSHIFSHFGTLKSNIQWCKIRQEHEETEEAKLLNNILSGERQFWMEIDKPLPSYASIEGRKVKVYHAGQKRTCARCQMAGETCPGKANAKLCDENGGVKVNVDTAWKETLKTVEYKEWNGVENTANQGQINDDKEEGVTDPVQEELAPIEGCTGIVFDNLEEDTTLDDIKDILKKVCPDDKLESCTLHPTGSLRSKIIQDIEPSLLPTLAKKVDKSNFKGRMIFCKPYVPKTPPKKENETTNADVILDTPAAIDESQSPSKQAIPGLLEADRIKATKAKEKKERKAKENKRESKKENIDLKNLSQKDFLLNPKSGDLTENFVFHEDSVDSDAFEDSKDEHEEENPFSTPITLKSAFAKIVERSEIKSRSRSTSVKRQFVSADVEDKNNKKSKKSGIPAARKIASLSK